VSGIDAEGARLDLAARLLGVLDDMSDADVMEIFDAVFDSEAT
jgi:hypothetical protein